MLACPTRSVPAYWLTCVFPVLGIEPRTSYELGKCFTTKLQLQFQNRSFLRKEINVLRTSKEKLDIMTQHMSHVTRDMEMAQMED